MIVYIAENKANGMCYVGATHNSLNRRMVQHKHKASHGSKAKIHQAIREFGIDAFDWSVIYETDNEDDLLRAEMFYIIMYNAVNNGYNTTNGGERANFLYGERNGMFGRTHSDDARNAIRTSKTGQTWDKIFGEECSNVKEKHANRMRGRKHKPETIQKMKDNSYWKNNGKQIEGINNPNYGNRWTDEMKSRVSGENNGMFNKGHLVKGDRNGMYGKKHTDKVVCALREINSGTGNPNYRNLNPSQIDLLVSVFRDTGSIGQAARSIGDNYNKAKRELVRLGIIDNNYRQTI